MNKTFQRSLVGAGLKLLGAYWVATFMVGLIWYVIANPVVDAILMPGTAAPTAGGRVQFWSHILWYVIWVLCGGGLIWLSDVFAERLCRLARMQRNAHNHASHAPSAPAPGADSSAHEG